jgi:uncharacterized membrane protein
MNIHPLFVHFPIALLTLYALLELLRFGFLKNQYVFYIKVTLLLVGTATTFLALPTGGLAERYHEDVADLVEKHAMFAVFSTLIFLTLSVNYIVKLLADYYLTHTVPVSLLKTFNFVFLMRRKIFAVPVIVFLAALGLIFLIITGALGGSIAHGFGQDPVTDFITSLVY